jgi:hypothetical protein
MINVFKRNPSVLAMEGLGNQLFQYAMGHHLATQSGTFAYLLTPFTPWRKDDRPFALDSLLNECKHLRLYEDTRFRTLRGLERLNSFLITHLGFSLPVLRIRLDSIDYARIPRRYVKRFVCTGFYLDFSFLREELEMVLKELHIHLEKFASPQEIIVPYGVLHVRRGDFDLINFGRLNSAYFKKSLLSMPRVSEIVVVTDSPNEVRELASELNISSIYGPDRLGSMETLALMSRAEFVIGSNSTFSWWGSVLCCFNGGISMLPNRWFRGQALPMTSVPGFDLIFTEPTWQD